MLLSLKWLLMSTRLNSHARSPTADGNVGKRGILWTFRKGPRAQSTWVLITGCSSDARCLAVLSVDRAKVGMFYRHTLSPLDIILSG